MGYLEIPSEFYEIERFSFIALVFYRKYLIHNTYANEYIYASNLIRCYYVRNNFTKLCEIIYPWK